MELGNFLRLAISITDALAKLHKQLIVHKEITPQHILVDPLSGKATLTDSRQKASPEPEAQNKEGPRQAEQVVAYLSPEQLGRLNRVVDFRSDLYSLGIVLYQLLCGKLPFQARDLPEWVHCHIARIPAMPVQLVPAAPPVVSEIIMKLLAKPVEERYQTALGLQQDLVRCLKQFEGGGELANFPLAEGDLSDQILIPEKLYGREKDIDLLSTAFARVLKRGVPEAVMVAGYSGIGKTSLVRQLYRSVIREHGFFISGKFDQYKRNIPYSTIIEAFQGLIRLLLSEHEDRLAAWKQRLQDALGINGRIIVDIIPQVELIIGKQPPIPELPLSEAEHRFNMVLHRFIGVFSSKEHPLVIFLDDLQWIDSASLKLLEHIITDQDTRHLLLIGAYRDNEVEPTHPLRLALNTIGNSAANLRTITLSPLSFRDLGRLLTDTFHTDQQRVESLTRLIYDKTAGNPFFVLQFLMTLHSERLVTFNVGDESWQWDVESIRTKGYTDNVVDLLTANLEMLQPKTCRLLRLAACIGSTFNLATLAEISDCPVVEARECLGVAVREMLLFSPEENLYSFVHDRVQQAAYSLTPEERRRALHLRIGRLLLAKIDSAAPGETIFDIVNQCNLGVNLIENREEKYRLAELNLMAGRKAKGSSAYLSAREYVSSGVALLEDAVWQSRHELAFSLYKELAEVEYLNGNYDQSRELIDLLLSRTDSTLQRAELYNILIIQYTLIGQYEKAIATGRKALQSLDVTIPEMDLPNQLSKELTRYRQVLGKKSIPSLANDPEMSDPKKRLSMDLLATLLVPARYTDHVLFDLIATISVNLSMQFGPTAKATVGYTAFGMLLHRALNSYRDAYDFGVLALKISERFNDAAQKCQASMVLGHYLNHWVKHLKCADNILSNGFRDGLAAGEMQWTGYTLAYKLFQPYYRGVPLPELQKEIPGLLSFTMKTKNRWATDTLAGLQLALSLLTEDGGPSDETLTRSSVDDVHNFLDECEKNKSFGALGRYAVLQAEIHYIYGHMEEALEAIDRARALTGFFSSSISIAELNFFTSLVYAALCSPHSDETTAAYLKKIRDNQQTMRIWVDHCPENFNHQYLLVEAEVARIEGRIVAAEHLFEEAVQAARDNGFIQHEAVANELAGKFFRERKLATIARAYLKEARGGYLRWGAAGKVKQLDRHHPWFRQKEEETGTSSTVDIQLGNLDAMAVIKASQAISGEIVLENLLETLMRTVIENAGAQKGCLILVSGAELRMAAKAVVHAQEIKVLQTPSCRLDADLPMSMLNYVRRTGETVIVDDATAQEPFSSDPYILSNQPLSVLCLPILRQTRMVGILYLENSLVSGAFTKGKLAVLTLLAGQAAISLENAALYLERSKAEQALRESEEKYRAIFEDSGTPLLFVEDDKTISICNKAFETLSGYSKEEVEGRKKWTEVVAKKEDLERMSEYHRLRRIDPKAAPQSYEFQLLCRGGQLKDVAANISLMPGTRKSLAALVDNSERNRAVEALHRSERKFRAIFDRSFQFIGLLTTEGIVLEANETVLEFAGLTSSDILGRPFWDTPLVNHPHGQPEKMRQAVGKAAEGELVRFETTHIAADGSLHYIDFSLKPVKDATGKVTLLIPEGRDITERKQAEQEQARLVTAIEQSAEAVCITDIDFTIRYVNPTLEKMSGFTRDEMVGQQHSSILVSGQHDGKTLASAMFHALLRGEVWSGRLFYKRKLHSHYEAEVTASPVRDKSGTIINYVSIHRDITREVQLERELRQAHKMEAIGTLAGGIAHDFNNILAVIQGHTQLVNVRLPKDSPVQHSLEQVLKSCSRAKDMVRQILAFSRQSEHEKQPFRMTDLVEEVLQLLRSSLPTTIEMIRNIDIRPEESIILADSTQIHQVLMNLATNAAHAMGAQGGILGVELSRIRISNRQAADLSGLAPGDYIRLSVSDTGHGMDSGLIERIFDPYFTTKGPGEGSGMGLAVCQGIVKAHHGKITVESEPGSGTTFRVYFPTQTGEFLPEPRKKETLPTGDERILLVDDEQALADMVLEMLSFLGYKVTARTKSLEALQTFQKHPLDFDLVISDMTMPALNGIELATKIMSVRPEIPVILCTGYSELIDEQKAKAAGIRELMMKPCQISELASTVRRVLQQATQQPAAFTGQE